MVLTRFLILFSIGHNSEEDLMSYEESGNQENVEETEEATSPNLPGNYYTLYIALKSVTRQDSISFRTF